MKNISPNNLSQEFSCAKNFNIELICEDLIKNNFAHITNIFPESLLNSLHEEIHQLDVNYELQLAGIGRGSDHTIENSIRKDKISWIDGETLAQCSFQEKLEELRLDLNKRLMLGLFDSESHYAVYRQGDFYKRHLDSFMGSKNCIISMVLYLNKEWQAEYGGILNAYENTKSKIPFAKIIPQWGEVILFLSEKIPHEVTQTTKNRYSIATWFRCYNENPLINIK